MADTVQRAGLSVTKELLLKLLGPAADFYGEEFKAHLEARRSKNVDNICENAISKVGDKINRPGQVPPRILRGIINEGSYMEDTLAVEYLGGILASSRTEVGRDDRGACMIKIIENLSAYQIRTHYLIYSLINRVFLNRNINLASADELESIRLFIPENTYDTVLDWSSVELEIQQMNSHIWHGLNAENLILNFYYGDKDSLCRNLSRFGVSNPSIQKAGVFCLPSTLGAELFLWALGHGDKPLSYLLSKELNTAEIDERLFGLVAEGCAL